LLHNRWIITKSKKKSFSIRWKYLLRKCMPVGMKSVILQVVATTPSPHNSKGPSSKYISEPYIIIFVYYITIPLSIDDFWIMLDPFVIRIKSSMIVYYVYTILYIICNIIHDEWCHNIAFEIRSMSLKVYFTQFIIRISIVDPTTNNCSFIVIVYECRIQSYVGMSRFRQNEKGIWLPFLPKFIFVKLICFRQLLFGNHIQMLHIILIILWKYSCNYKL